MDYEERRYSAQDGLRLYYRRYGDPLSPRTPVLCLAGLTRNARDFHDFARRISADRMVLCPDLRGRGCSAYDPDWRHYDPQTYLGDVVQLLTIANVHRVIAVGTSLGGLLTMGLAAVAPTALAAAVINDIGPEMRSGGLETIIEYISVDRPQPDWDSARDALSSLLPGVVFQTEAMADDMLHNTFREGDDGLLHFDWDVDIIKPTVRSGGRLPDLWPVFRGLRLVPTLAFRGEHSGLLDEACFERMGAEHPRMRRVTVPGTGHAPTLTEPECATAIDEFLSDL